MDTTYSCEICHKSFTRSYNLVRHQEQIHKNQINCKKRGPPKKKWICETCGRELSSKHTLELHQQKVCKLVTSDVIDVKLKEVETKLRQEFDEKMKSRGNNVLQIICVTSNDNYLDMLTTKTGDFNRAIEYIKECALSQISGDCKLIEKIYLDQNESQIFYTDHKKSKVKYYGESGEIIESKEAFAKKIANNLQNSYLKGINYLINQNLDSRANPNKFLEEYDIMAWNTHIYTLSDIHYQTKVINQLNLPCHD